MRAPLGRDHRPRHGPCCHDALVQQPATERRLLLLRHAKSDWGDASVPDHDRRLNARGRRSLPLVAAYLARQDAPVEQVLVSTARRAAETVSGVTRELRPAPEIVTDRFLYLATAHEVLARIAQVPDEVRTLLVCGHNPGMQELARTFGHGGAFPTAALATVGCDGPWSSLGAATCRL